MSVGEHDPGSAVARRAARGLLSLSGARVVSLLVQVVVFAILAKHLGPSGIGLFAFGVAISQLFGTLSNFGFKQVVIRQVSQEPECERWLVPNYLYLRIVLACLAFGGLAGAVVVIGYSPDQRRAALVAGLLLAAGALSAFAATVEARLRTGWIAAADVIEAALLLGGVLFLVWRGAAVFDFLWLLVVVNVVNQLVITAVAQRLTRYAWRPRPRRWWPIARMAIPLGLASILVTIYYQIDIAILGRIRTDADVGQYGAAYRVLNAAIVLPAVLMTVLSPILARSAVAGHAVFQRRFSVVVHLLALLAAPIGLAGAITAWRVLPHIPGFAEFGRGGVALSILSPAAALIFLAVVVQGALIAGHLQRRLLGIAAAGAGLNLVLNLAVIPTFGIYGAAVTTAATETLVLALSLREARRGLGLRWPVARLPALARALLVMVVVLVVAGPLHPFLQLALGTLAYLAALLPTHAFRWSDLGGILGVGESTDEIALAPADDLPLEGVDVLPRSARAVRRRLAGVASCRIHARGAVPLRVLLAARAAGCAEVVAVEHDAPSSAPAAAVRRLVADRVEHRSRHRS